MCSHFFKIMDNYQGDLADIIRATSTTVDCGSTAAEAAAATVVPDSWQTPSNTISCFSDQAQDFGDPFTYMRNPIMQNIDPGFFYNSNIIDGGGKDTGNSGGFASNGGNSTSNLNLAHKVLDHDELKRPSNIFSRMLQISPSAKLPVPQCDPQAAAGVAAPPRGLRGPSLLVPKNRTLISPSSSTNCLVESSGMQISSPRNTGIKRRKSQAKKVVCIPAPAPANSRATGEVVPSDLWAWRKYGQKPIKGSPYPRGYYRCSSSKGCSARKQVERSRTDPNMLVITYTSEHNHPWPTQRNSLAGSTRSQPSKNTSAAKNSSPNSQTQKPTNSKQEKEISTEKTVISSTADENSAAVKEETDQDINNQLEMEEAEFDEGFLQTYRPTLAHSNHSEDSFFADLGEIEADPLNLLFTQGFSRDESGRENNDLDPFNFYDWATNNSNTPASTTTTTTVGSTTCYGESNRDT